MPVLNLERPAFMAEEDIVIFEDAMIRFFDDHAPESRTAKWREDGMVERAMWTEAAEAGLSCLSIPEEYGGMGGDYRHEAILIEQLGLKGVDGFGLSLHNAIVAPYILHCGTEEQKKRWLPRMANGELRRRHRHDRTRRGLGPSGHQDHRQDGRQRVRHQRLQDLHHQRPDRQPDLRRRQDRPDARRARHVPHHGGDRRRRPASSAAATSTSSARKRPTPPNCSSTTCMCPPTMCSAATRARASSSSWANCRRSA